MGKSTLFNALTSEGEAANYPFCTIDPNVGVVTVPDPRMDKICGFIKPQQAIPTTIEFVDIAGLVKGASKGEGLGNQFSPTSARPTPSCRSRASTIRTSFTCRARWIRCATSK